MKICPQCGYLFRPKEAPDTAPRQAKYQQGVLDAVNVSFRDNNTNVTNIIHKPTTIEDFIIVADKKNYRHSWAAFRALDYVTSYDECLHIADVCGYKRGWAWHQWQNIQSEISAAKILANARLSG